jgi:hypothetical protein
MVRIAPLPYRQADGLIGSNINLLGLTLSVPDHTTFSRRSATPSVQPQPTNIGPATVRPSACLPTAPT